MFSSDDVTVSYAREIVYKGKMALPVKISEGAEKTWNGLVPEIGKGWVSNEMSRGTGPTGAQQDRAWEIAKGLRPALQQKTMVKAA